MKIFAGFPRSYLASPWHVFDFTLVVLDVASLASTETIKLLGLAAGGAGAGTSFLPTVRVLKFLRILKILRAVRLVKMLQSLKHVVAILIKSAVSVGVCLLILIFVFFNGSIIGSKLFGHLCTAQHLDTSPPPPEALRCLLLREEDLIPRHVGFDSLANGVTTLAVISTLDGWVRKMHRFRVHARPRPPDHMQQAMAGARIFHNASLDAEARRNGLMLAREALPGCAYTWELQALQAEGLVECYDGPWTGAMYALYSCGGPGAERPDVVPCQHDITKA